MNKSRLTSYRPGDEVSYAMPSGMLYGTVTRVLGEGESSAIEVEFEDGRKEIKKIRDRALNLLRRASGMSEEEERHGSRERLQDHFIWRAARGHVVA